MQDGGQDSAVGELDGYAFYGHIQCCVAAAIGVVPTGAVIADRTGPCAIEGHRLHFARGNVFDETPSDIDRRNGIDPYDLGKLVHVRQHYRARSVMREGCRVVDKEVDRRAAQLLCKGVDGAFIRDIKSVENGFRSEWVYLLSTIRLQTGRMDCPAICCVLTSELEAYLVVATCY